MSFTVEQEAFSGPLGLLLELIDKQELEITKVSLAKVAEDYLAKLSAEDIPGDELADFLLIASRLIYLKSRELLPYLRLEEEEVSADKLQDQLRLYKEFVAVAKKIETRYLVKRMYIRPRPLKIESQVRDFIYPQGLSAALMHASYQGVLAKIRPFLALQEVSLDRVKSVEERLQELSEALSSRASLSFKQITVGAKSKAEVVMSFLALLELLRRQMIKVNQSAPFGDINLTRAA